MGCYRYTRSADLRQLIKDRILINFFLIKETIYNQRNIVVRNSNILEHSLIQLPKLVDSPATSPTTQSSFDQASDNRIEWSMR
jgi:hypothetical protein